MKAIFLKFKTLLVLGLLILGLSNLSGCGGGSGGTGSSQRLFGNVSTSDSTRSSLRRGVPISGLQVTVLETGDSAVTDQNGDYEIFTEITDSVVDFLFEGQGFDSTVVIEDIDVSALNIEIDFEANPSTESISVSRIVIDGIPKDPPPSGDETDGDDDSSQDGSSGDSDDSDDPPSPGGGGTGTPDPDDGGGSDKEKVTICHNATRDPSRQQTLAVSNSALQSHLDHGDVLGACPE